MTKRRGRAPDRISKRKGRGVDLDRLRAELPTASAARGDARPVEDVHAPAVSPPPGRPALDKPKTGQAQPLGSRHRRRERRAHLRQDAAGVPCACDDTTPCLAHAGITGRRRWLRPK